MNGNPAVSLLHEPVMPDTVSLPSDAEKGGPEERPSDRYYNRLLSESITASLGQVIRIIGPDPALLMAATRLLSSQKRAAGRRLALEKEGVQVPAVVMLSLTHRCNLACHGCYMRSLHPVEAPEMTPSQLSALVSQCVDIGVSFLVMAGGEPLVRKDDILMLARAFPVMMFAVFTNGLLIDESLAAAMGKQKNLVPILSIEGKEEMTDARRSEGVFDAAIRAFALLRKNKVFFGCSVTVTRHNYTEVTSDRFIRDMLDSGCRLFVYVEFVPVQGGTEDLALTDLQQKRLCRLLEEYASQYPALFLGFPGDEELFGGCLSAGRGFIHVSPSGDLEPCPAAPFSDVNVTRVSLKEALKSEFLARIRSHHEMLSESGGGCALWTNRGWVASVLASQGDQN